MKVVRRTMLAYALKAARAGVAFVVSLTPCVTADVGQPISVSQILRVSPWAIAAGATLP
ncbi:MAG: hypothetical protein ABIS21_05200 [Acidimicrobiales bacterium]